MSQDRYIHVKSDICHIYFSAAILWQEPQVLYQYHDECNHSKPKRYLSLSTKVQQTDDQAFQRSLHASFHINFCLHSCFISSSVQGFLQVTNN